MKQRLDEAIKSALAEQLQSKTQIELANQAGVSHFKVNRIYRDKHLPLRELADMFDAWGFNFQITVRDMGAAESGPAD